eukprot:gene35953-43604_t
MSVGSKSLDGSPSFIFRSQEFSYVAAALVPWPDKVGADQLLEGSVHCVESRKGATTVAIIPSLYDLGRAEVFKQVQAGHICPGDVRKFLKNHVEDQFWVDLDNLVIKFTTPSPSSTPQKQLEETKREHQHRPKADLISTLKIETLLQVAIDNQVSIQQMLKVAAEERKVAAEERKATLGVQDAMIKALTQLTQSLSK